MNPDLMGLKFVTPNFPLRMKDVAAGLNGFLCWNSKLYFSILKQRGLNPIYAALYPDRGETFNVSFSETYLPHENVFLYGLFTNFYEFHYYDHPGHFEPEIFGHIYFLSSVGLTDKKPQPVKGKKFFMGKTSLPLISSDEEGLFRKIQILLENSTFDLDKIRKEVLLSFTPQWIVSYQNVLGVYNKIHRYLGFIHHEPLRQEILPLLEDLRGRLLITTQEDIRALRDLCISSINHKSAYLLEKELFSSDAIKGKIFGQ